MSSTQQLLLGEGAGGGPPVFIEDVFSTYLYTGNGYNQTIYNNIQLASGVNLIPGQALGGGYFGGFISTTADGVATHALIVAPKASGENSNKAYKNAATSTAGADSAIDGPQNTVDMVADGDSTVYPAAHFCNDLVIGGFSDWYMPAQNELEVCYYNLKPTTDSNDTSSGTNTNAVPSRSSDYTAGTPSQTTATIFQTGNAEAFVSNNYWSSTETASTTARSQNFTNGQTVARSKTSGEYVRAIRRIAINDAALDPYRVTGKGGMVWIKSRSAATNHALADSTMNLAAFDCLIPNATNAKAGNGDLNAFNSNGFSLGYYAGSGNVNGSTYASWTFREQPKFFDIVTYTGTGSARTVAHSLGSVPGCIIVKETGSANDWVVYHRSLGNNSYIILNSTGASASSSTRWNDTTPTSTVFTVDTNNGVNANGASYVAYLFAHDAGGFGLTGTDNVISCGSFTTDGSGNASVNLGYEAQFVMIKASADSGYNWDIQDIMRGAAERQASILSANLSAAEVNYTIPVIVATSTGFKLRNSVSSIPFIYIAIRRGPMKVPTSGTSVYGAVAYSGDGTTGRKLNYGFSPDLALYQQREGNASYMNMFIDRLRGDTRQIQSWTSAAEGGFGNATVGVHLTTGPSKTIDIGVNSSYINASGSTYIMQGFGRAPGFFDEVCYIGTGSATTFSHNLSVVPELMIVKRRDDADSWFVYHANNTGSPATQYLELNSTAATSTYSGAWNNTVPTSSVFTVGSNSSVSASTYVNYLFATCAGVSKVGSYTGTGTTLQVNCGFTGGARFVMIKRTDSTGDWYVWDSARGIVAGNDPYLLLNSTAAEVTNTDYVDTYSAGFEVTSTAPAGINANGGTYIFLAIA